MDWISWLSKSTLHPSLIYEYGLSFSHNELEHEDIIYFNHEFLQSIGISIAKHRLEILKLARHDAAATLRRRPITRRLLLALSNTKRRFSDLIRNLSHRAKDDTKKALILVPKSNLAGRSLKRDKKLVAAKRQGRFLITNGSPPAPGGLWPPRIESFSGPIVYDLRREKEDCYWGNDVEEFRWDAMFQNLKPT